MPGLYLLAILASATGVGLLDRRFRLALWRSPGRTAGAVAVGTAFFLGWDAVGIAFGVFAAGDSPLYLGVLLAPELPIEEVFFLAFLCYLSLVLWSGASGWGKHRGPWHPDPGSAHEGGGARP